VFPLHQIAHVGVNERTRIKLFGREIIGANRKPEMNDSLLINTYSVVIETHFV